MKSLFHEVVNYCECCFGEGVAGQPEEEGGGGGGGGGWRCDIIIKCGFLWSLSKIETKLELVDLEQTVFYHSVGTRILYS